MPISFCQCGAGSLPPFQHFQSVGRFAAYRVGSPTDCEARITSYNVCYTKLLRLFVDDTVADAHLEETAFLVDPLVVVDVELGLGEGGGDFVFYHFHLDVIADDVSGGVFEGIPAADIQADAGIEFERFAAIV